MSLIEIQNLTTNFGSQIIHRDLNLTVGRGEVMSILGGSGSGKTTLLRCMLNLLRPYSGTISIFDIDITTANEEKMQSIRRRWGVMFQQAALFSSLTALENVMFPLNEFTALSFPAKRRIAELKLGLSGLPQSAFHQLPSSLSGGMKKRTALARALVMDPELLFLDEPVAGLDPKSAYEFDQLILELKQILDLTVVMVSHDIESVARVSSRCAFLGEGRVLVCDAFAKVAASAHPIVHDYFSKTKLELEA